MRGFAPPPSFGGGSNEGRPQLPRAPVGGGPVPAEGETGTPAPEPPELGCLAGESRCSAERVELCSPAGDWLLVEECVGAALCNATLGRCVFGCVPGETRCNGARVEQCNADATGFQVIAECPADLCLGDSDGAACVNACEPGETRCVGPGPQLGRCNDELTGFDIVEACSTRCDALLCGPNASADAGVAPGAPPPADPALPPTDPVIPATDPVAPPADPVFDAGAPSNVDAAAE